MKYRVLREHFGGRMFRAGDEREARPSDVGHLVASGVLAVVAAEKPEGKDKAGAKVDNKAAPPVANKAGA